MKKYLSLNKLLLIIENEKFISQDKIKFYLLYRYKDILSKLSKKYSLTKSETSKMLFYPYYALEITLEIRIYKMGNSKFLLKKPNIFFRIFRKISKHSLTFIKDKILFDDKLIDDELANKIIIHL